MRDPALQIVRAAGSRATEHAAGVLCAGPRPARSRRVQPPPERWTAPAGHPRPCTPMTGRSRDGRPGQSKHAAAAIVARRAAATDAVCGRAGATAPVRSAAVRRDRVCAARGCECRAAGRAGCRSFPWQTDRARRARETKADQDQVIEIPGFRFRKAGWSRTDQAVRQRFPASAGFQRRGVGESAQLYVPDMFLSRHLAWAASGL